MFDQKFTEKFWSKVNKSNDCWLWQAAQQRGRYGETKYHSKSFLAHRVSWMLTHGPIPENLRVCHKCDNPRCVNPNHLFLGTDADNIKDRDNKNRTAIFERNGNARTNQKIVRQIRAEYESKTTTHRNLAKKYGLSKTQIGRIIRQESWRMNHV